MEWWLRGAEGGEDGSYCLTDTRIISVLQDAKSSGDRGDGSTAE